MEGEEDTHNTDPKYDEIRLFNASLFCDGRDYVARLLERELANLDSINLDLESISTAIKRRHEDLATALNRPTFALDECHILFEHCKGLLFHSNFYKQKELETAEVLLQWQLYECKEPKNKIPPPNYPYRRPTTLFTGFRTVVEVFLIVHAKFQTTVLLSTYFSVWEPLLNKQIVSRSEPAIQRFVLSARLHFTNLVDVLVAECQADKSELETGKIAKHLKKWRGRPGLFFNYFLAAFQCMAKSGDLRARMQTAHDAATALLRDKVFDVGLIRIQSLDRPLLAHDRCNIGIPPAQLCSFMIFCFRLCGGNVCCLSTDLAELVASGFVIVKTFDWGHQSIGLVRESIVKDYLLSRSYGLEALAVCDNYIAFLLRHSTGSSHGNNAEFALVNKIISYHGEPLQKLIGDWSPNLNMPSVSNSLHGIIMAKWAASLGDLKRLNHNSAVDTFFSGNMLRRITRPRDGIVLPECFFFASSPGHLSVITVQLKVHQQKLVDSDFLSAIQSTSTCVVSCQCRRGLIMYLLFIRY